MVSSPAFPTLALCSSFATHCNISNHHYQNSLLFSPSKTTIFSLSKPVSWELTSSPLLFKTPTFCTIPTSSESKAAIVEAEPDNVEPELEPEPAQIVEAAKEEPKREEIFAVVMIGSRQYIVFPGRYLYTQRLKDANVNDKIVLNKVLLVGTKTTTYIGKPVVTNAAVHAVVEEQGLNPKVVVFKYKKKKNYRRNIGHRQPALANLAPSSSTSVPTHSYGTRTKTKALEEVYAQTLLMLSQNPLFDISSSIQGLEESSIAQHVSSQGTNASRQFSFNEHDSKSSSAFVPSSPSKTSFEVMNVMTTSTTSLEEQIALFSKIVDTIIATI
ncbi:hypothetical protein CRYUN_Cryun28dG0006400 [Craigia yunnanensis]